jgi:symplekin
MQKIKCDNTLSLFFFLHQVLHTLTDGTIPSTELLFTIRKLYDSKVKVYDIVFLILEKNEATSSYVFACGCLQDLEILIPILPFLSKDEVLSFYFFLYIIV